MLKISIVTPTFNQGRYIRDCIDSVLSQNYCQWEHIVIDGGSSDETVEILRSYQHLKWISEKDKGSVFALNKGIKMATGDIVGWLNSDDFYEPDIFKIVVDEFENLKFNFICGNLNFVDKNKNIVSKDSTVKCDLEYLVRKDPYVIRTPAAFYSRKILEKAGYFDEAYKIVFDYEMFVKLLTTEKIKFVNKTISNYRFHEDTLSKNNVRKQTLELWEISKKYGRKIYDPITFLLLKNLFKSY
jgi:glycosyltransferase involved in cell wall biosynthesis